jgi:hypothetical protein
MDEIRDVVKAVLHKMASHRRPDATEIYEYWQKLVDPQDLAYTKVIDFQHETLFILVDSSVRLYKLNLQREKFLKQIQGQHPEIKRIHFKIGKV